MNHWRTTASVTACAAALVATACVRTSDGVPVADPSLPSSTSSFPSPRSTITSTPPDPAPPGILPTLQVPIPANSVTCAPTSKPPVSVVAATDDAQAPRLTVGLPDGWSTSKGSGDVGAHMNGPDGMSATVSIAATTLDPEAAFRDYTDKIMAQSAVSSVSALPAELCQYSGQKLMGAWSDTPENAVEFFDRVAHVWTNTTNYLVVIHVEAPTGVDALEDASAAIANDVEITIP
jgi:hypothetical protein